MTLIMTEEEYFAEVEAIDEGTATQLVHCYICFREETGRLAGNREGPLRGVVNHGTVFGFDPVASAKMGYDGDPYESLTLAPCGHTII